VRNTYPASSHSDNRIRALLKRYHSTNEGIVSTENIVESRAGIIIDKDRYVVVRDGKDIVLPKKDFELLNTLISRPEKVFTREEIFHSVWGDKIIVGDRTIDVHIRKLREKIGEEYIKTIKGVGYKFAG
jgi:two-component system alkaline phosphatase synthesis response regulator PhoP